METRQPLMTQTELFERKRLRPFLTIVARMRADQSPGVVSVQTKKNIAYSLPHCLGGNLIMRADQISHINVRRPSSRLPSRLNEEIELHSYIGCFLTDWSTLPVWQPQEVSIGVNTNTIESSQPTDFESSALSFISADNYEHATVWMDFIPRHIWGPVRLLYRWTIYIYSRYG